MPDPEFILLGDAIWTDFLNTERGTGTESRERLTDLAAYHRWVKAGKLTSDASTVDLDDVLLLRDQLSRLAGALIDGKPAPTASITAINSILAATPGSHQLVRVKGDWHQRFTPADPPTAFDAIARSAARTLSDRHSVLRQCLGEGCSLVLIDNTPQHTRISCRPATCGSRPGIDRRRPSR